MRNSKQHSDDAIMEIARAATSPDQVQASQRIDCSPDNIEQGLAKLVLSLVELLRQVLERQAIRRMEGGSLQEEQVEKMGEALMALEAKIHELSASFGLTPADLNIDLGPLGHLLEK